MQYIGASPFRTFMVCTLFMALCLSGCASKYGDQTTPVNAYPQCYQPIADLRADENSVGTSTAGGAVAGAFLGALIGGLATGKASGALIGAAAGGATGAVAGHAYGTSKSRAREQEFVRAYAQQLDGETAAMDRASAAAQVACQCYDREFQKAAAAAKAGTMDKAEFSRRYQEIRAGLDETSRILNTASTDVAQKDAEYQKILAEEHQAATRPQEAQNVQVIANKTRRWQNSKTKLQQAEYATRQQASKTDSEYQKLVAALDV